MAHTQLMARTRTRKENDHSRDGIVERMSRLRPISAPNQMGAGTHDLREGGSGEGVQMDGEHVTRHS